MALKLNAITFQSPKYPSFALPPMASLISPKFLMASTLRFGSKDVESVKKPFSPPREVHVQVTHSMPPQKIEIFKSMEEWAENNLLVHLKPVEKSWQPQDFLPDPASDGFHDEVKELRERAREIPDDYFVVLVGDMITEEALPTYQTMLNTLDGVRDETGASPTPWAIWTRAWTAEENRHGDLLNKYLYLSGRVDMRQIEKTIQYLIASGMFEQRVMLTPPCLFWNLLRIQELKTARTLDLSIRPFKKGLLSSPMEILPDLPGSMGTLSWLKSVVLSPQMKSAMKLHTPR
ncbi:hypothetical protein ACS0TY_025720 [Phlomoides rotata]